MVAFTDLKQIASTKSLGQNPEVTMTTIARVKKNQIGGVDVFSIRSQDAWKQEFPDLWTGNGMRQGKWSYRSDIFRLFKRSRVKLSQSDLFHPVNLLL